MTSPIRDRTRAAILAAAASLWAQDRAATLSDIADAAGVGRSTIHRYFTGRDHLLESTIIDSAEVMERVVSEAQLDQGSPADAMRRLVTAMVEVGDRMLFLFDDPAIVEKLGKTNIFERPHDPVLELIRRGQTDGSFDSSVSAEWIQHVVFALVYTGYVKRQDGVLLKHDVVPTIVHTLSHGILQLNDRR